MRILARRERLTRQQRQHRDKLFRKLQFFPGYIEEYVDDMLSGSSSPSTLLSYLYDFETFFKWLMAEGIAPVNQMKDIPLTVLENLKLKEANTFFTWLKIEQELQDETINRKKSSLKSLFKFLTERTEDEDGECYFYRNVMAKVKMAKETQTLSSRAERISQKIFHGDEIENFIKFVSEEYPNQITNKQQKIYFNRDRERDLAIITLLLASGIRVSELANLSIDSLNLIQRKLYITRKGGKEETVYFRKFALPFVKNYLDIRKSRYQATEQVKDLFLTIYRGSCQPISIRSIQQMISKYTKAYRGEKLSPHKLRHSFATEYAKINSMYDLMRQLGHTSTDISILYINATEEQSKEAIDKLDE